TLLDQLRRDRRAAPEREGPLAVLVYHDLVNDHAFFLKDPAERLRRLYQAYRAHPKLSAAVAAEQGGAAFAEALSGARGCPGGADRVFAEALYEGKHPCVQASFYVEHRARLSILKAAVDLCCLAPDERALARALSGLPPTFRAGLRRLRSRPSFRR